MGIAGRGFITARYSSILLVGNPQNKKGAKRALTK